MPIALPHELWSKIISFLVRDKPEPRTTKHWFDLHQDDLCSMMRVNSTFHDLTAPHLYDKAVVPCITAFMRNIETTEVMGKKVEIKIIKPGIKTKKDMLAHVREIHLVYYPTVFEPSYKKLFKENREEDEGWDRVGMTAGQLFEIEDECLFQRAAQVAGNITSRNDILATGNDLNPFPRLETLTVGANGDDPWQEREAQLVRMGGEVMRESLARSKTMLLAILSVSQPKHVCLHTLYGMSSPPTDCMFNPKSPNELESFNVHVDGLSVDLDTFEPHWPVIICGTFNRWHYRFPFTRLDLSQEGDMLKWPLESLALELNNTYLQFNKMQPFEGGQAIDITDTELEIWGVGRSKPIASRVRDMLSPDEYDNKEAQHTAWEKCCTEDDELLTRLEERFDTLLCDAWKGKVSFFFNDFMSPCDGCGDTDHSDGSYTEHRIITTM